MEIPAEITHEIFALLGPRDICNLRLTSKWFAAVGLKHICEEVNVVFRPSSFNRLKKISEHPVHSTAVKKITFWVDFVINLDKEHWAIWACKEHRWISNPPVTGSTEYAAYVAAAADPLELHPRSFTQKQRDSAFAHHRKLYREQCQLINSASYFGSLKSSLPLLKSLRGLDVKTLNERGARNPKLAILPMLYQPRGSQHFFAWDIYVDNYSIYTVAVTVLHAAMIALGNASRLTALHTTAFTPGMVSSRMANFDAICASVQNIRYLNLLPPTTGNLSYMLDDTCFLNALLCGMTKLEEFIYMSPKAYYSCPRFSTDHILGQGRWSRLRDLRLCGVDVRGENFISFLQRHKQALRTVVLTGVTLIYPEIGHSWPDFLDSIRKTIRLHHFRLTGLLAPGITSPTFTLRVEALAHYLKGMTQISLPDVIDCFVCDKAPVLDNQEAVDEFKNFQLKNLRYDFNVLAEGSIPDH